MQFLVSRLLFSIFYLLSRKWPSWHSKQARWKSGMPWCGGIVRCASIFSTAGFLSACRVGVGSIVEQHNESNTGNKKKNCVPRVTTGIADLFIFRCGWNTSWDPTKTESRLAVSIRKRRVPAMSVDRRGRGRGHSTPSPPGQNTPQNTVVRTKICITSLRDPYLYV